MCVRLKVKYIPIRILHFSQLYNKLTTRYNVEYFIHKIHKTDHYFKKGVYKFMFKQKSFLQKIIAQNKMVWFKAHGLIE